MMKNSHSQGSTDALKTKIKPLPDSTSGDAYGHVNQDNKAADSMAFFSMSESILLHR
jgi:hypothetical protein